MEAVYVASLGPGLDSFLDILRVFFLFTRPRILLLVVALHNGFR